jgi:hypothetical protein
MPFGSFARNVTSVVPENAINNASNVAQYAMPWTQVEQGPTRTFVNLRWPTAVRGRVNATIRCDNPI